MSKRFIIYLLAGTLLYMSLPDSTFALNISGNADLTYRQSTTKTASVTTKTETRSERYYINLDLNKRLTSTIALNGSIGMRFSKTGDKESQDFLPQFNLIFSPPPYFNTRFSMGYNRTETGINESNWITTDYWNASITSSPAYWPTFALNYYLSRQFDYEDVHLVDSTTSTITATATYNFTAMDTKIGIVSSFVNTLTEGNVGNATTSETPSNRSNISLSRYFWGKRISVGSALGWSRTKSIQKSDKVQDFSRSQDRSEGLYIDNPPSPTSVTLSNTPSLIDNNIATTANLIDLTSINRNIGLRLSAKRKISKFYLYVNSTATAAQLGAFIFGFNIYKSNDNITWTKIPTAPTVTYNSIFRRYEIDWGGMATTAEYFKVVNTLFVALATVNVTELEAVGPTTETVTDRIETSSDRVNGSLNLTVKPRDWIDFSYNLSYSLSESESDAGLADNFKTTSLGQGINFSVTAVPKYLHFTGNYSNSTTSPSSAPESSSNSYGLSLNSTILPTLRGNLAYVRSDSLSDGALKSTTDSITTNINLGLYKGVDMRFTNVFSISKQIDSGTKSDSQSYQVFLSARPWRQVQWSTTAVKSFADTTSSNGGSTSSTSDTITSTITYYPTKVVYISANFNLEPTMSQSYFATWRIAKTLQTNFNYGTSDISDNMSATIRFTPFQRLTITLRMSETTSGASRSSDFLARASMSL